MNPEKEWRVIGPPGTGKTTFLAKQLTRAVEAGRRPMVTSLTRSAAYEIASRMSFSFDFAPDQVGTLHAHCYRALNRPALIESQDQIDDWNKNYAVKNPAWSLSPDVFMKDKGGGDGRKGFGIGNDIYLAANSLRAKMTPAELWPIEVAGFHKKFSEWKLASGLHDFTDLVELCLKNVNKSPIEPDVVFVDEAQDHDRLELSLVRKWAASAEQLIVCGDPDQNLYEFRGAEPEAFYAGEIPANQYIVLKQSYRVPRKVHAEAVGMIRRIKERRNVEYLPKDEPGEVFRAHLRLRQARELVDTVIAETEQGRTAMILASCEYMLGQIIQQLRFAGVPFHNPFAPQRGQFNPLGDKGGISSPQRLLSFLRVSEAHFGSEARLWTWGELAAWVDPVSIDGIFRRGAKAKIAEMGENFAEAVVDIDALRELGGPEGGGNLIGELDAIERDPVSWFVRRLNGSRAKAFEFPVAILKRHGVAGIKETPKIIPGTIHSVKGGEADSVFLFPDLSPEAAEQYHIRPASIHRLFYVGMTRAIERLYLCQNSGQMAIRW